MEGDFEVGSNKDLNQKPKRKMKTPYQLEMLEKTYAMEMYPSEATREKLSEKLGLTDRQLQMWFCHRRLKEKKEGVGVGVGMGMASTKPSNLGSAGKRSLTVSPREEVMATEFGSRHDSGSESDSSQFDKEDDMQTRHYESPRAVMERRVIACVESQLGEPLRHDGPILGMEFEELPPGAFGASIALREQQNRHGHSYDNKLYGKHDPKHIKAASADPNGATKSKIRSDSYGHVDPGYPYVSPVVGAKKLSLLHGNERMPREYGVEGDIMLQPGRQVPFSSPGNADYTVQYEDIHMERKRKSDEVGREEVQAYEKKIRKEHEKQDLLRRKREEQMRKEMERQDRERYKEEQRMMREQQRQEEKFQREEKREMERREKFMQKEHLLAERMRQKEELRKEKEAARQKAAVERATARRIAKEYMELIEDERLELMELAASSKGLPSIVSLDYDSLQNLEAFQEALCEFPPKSVKLKLPFAVQPWISSEKNVGNLLMVWKFCVTFADALGLWPFTLDEFIQSFHDYDSRLLGEIHISLLKLIIKDIEDVVRTPSGGPGTNQYSAVNPEGGHPHIVEGAYVWGFDIRNWQKHLNPLTWPEILRQFALSAGFGPKLKKSIDRARGNDNNESKGCEDIVATLRNGSAAFNAVATMQEKGVSLQRKSRHRLTPGTVKFAAYHVLALEGGKGLNVIELADKIQKSGLRDLSTSKTPEASISVALSRDPILFERIAPSTYCVRPAFRKDPADAESVIADAKEKIQKYANGFLAGQVADEEERDDDSDIEVAGGPEVEAPATPSDTIKKVAIIKAGSCSVNSKDKLPVDAALQNGPVDIMSSNHYQGIEIDESGSGELWVQGLTEGEYSDLSVEERLNALVALIGVANEGNSIRVILEDRLDAANSLKKQMWAEAQLDKRRLRDEIITKYYNSFSSNTSEEAGLNPVVTEENKIINCSATTLPKDESLHMDGDLQSYIKNPSKQDTSVREFISPAQQNGYTAERSRLQLKSYIGHKAEETYAYRSLPLGLDRRRNRYWQFVASASSQDPGSGRIFVESPNGSWKLIDSEESLDALLTSLDTRGTRESHLHIMLRKIEVPFKECIQRNKSIPNILDKIKNDGSKEAFEVNSSGAVFNTHADTWESSLSFTVDLGRNETEQKNFCKRDKELQNWIWNVCFNPSTSCATAYGKKRCLPLLGICPACNDTYDATNDFCPSCHLISSALGTKGDFSINEINNLNSSPPRSRLIKALLTLVEVSVPFEALHSSWTEDCRSSWGSELQNASSSEEFLQILTQFEGAIRRDFLSADFETTEELLSSCGSLKGAGSILQLPWIPKTTAAVALRLFELDSSISYTPNQKAESYDEKKVEALPNFTSRFGQTNDNSQKGETMVFDRYGFIKEEKSDHLRGDTPGSSGYRKVVKGRGGRPRGKSQKGSKSQSGKQNTEHADPLTQVLLQQRATTKEQSHGWGRRTVRKRRTDNIKMVPLKEVADNQIQENLVNFSTANIEVENDDSSNSIEEAAAYSDDNNADEYEKWGAATYDATHNTQDEIVESSEEEDDDDIEDQNGYYEEGENLGNDTEMKDVSDRDQGSGFAEEGSESEDSGEDYSD